MFRTIAKSVLYKRSAASVSYIFNFFENILLSVITFSLQALKKATTFSKTPKRLIASASRKLNFGSLTPIQIVRRESRTRQIKSGKRTFRRLNVDDFAEDYGPVLGPYLTELCQMKIMSCRKKKLEYTAYQKWLSTNLYVACGRAGYGLLQKLFKLPDVSTIRKHLLKLKGGPGVSGKNARVLVTKVAPVKSHERLCWILMDEMSLRPGYFYNSRKDLIVGFSDDGEERSSKPVTSSLVVKVVGLTRNWKFPLGYYLNGKALNFKKIEGILLKSIEVLEDEGMKVVGVTTDQGANFDAMFRNCFNVEVDRPYFILNEKKYLVCQDPPHLIKNARNFLLNGEVKIPKMKESAKWGHIMLLQDMNESTSLKMVPKLTQRSVSPKQLLFGAKMKVKFAVNVLSNTVSASLRTLVQQNKIKKEVLATSIYCKKFNDIFDVLNSSSIKAKVPLRRPLEKNSRGIEVLKESRQWLEVLEAENLQSRPQVKFLRGMRQTINAVLELRSLFTEMDLPYLYTRRLCQDSLELLFGKIRAGVSHPTAANFEEQYCRISTASLMRAPITGSCQAFEFNNDQFVETASLFDEVSFADFLQVSYFLRCIEFKKMCVIWLMMSIISTGC